MPSERTMVTELGTALGMLGLRSIEEALHARPAAVRSLSPEVWDQLAALRSGGAYDAEFHAAWENGRAFLAASDGLRGRLPTVVEWKGAGRAPGDEVAPIDLRVDHVYLLSCKYLSKILFNVSPSKMFDDLLVGWQGRSGRPSRDHASAGADWYAAVAPAEYQTLYDEVRAALDDGVLADAGVGTGVAAGVDVREGAGTGAHDDQAATERPAPSVPAAASAGTAGLRDRSARDALATGAVSLPGLEEASLGAGDSDDHRIRADNERRRKVPRGVPADLRGLPTRAVDLTSEQRDALGRWLRPAWPGPAKDAYARLSQAVASASVRHWEAAMDLRGGNGEAMLWRLLRMGSAPYFVLGSSDARSLRLRIATPWDWRQAFSLVSIALSPQTGGQPRVGWEALVRHRTTHEVRPVAGHIEVRWSHGRFGGPPEAKGYLDTPHHQVPGYFPLR